MKVLWGFEPTASGTASVKGMAKLIASLVPEERNLEIGYVVTENESFFYTAPAASMKERSSSLPKELIMSDLKRAGVKIAPSKINIVHQPTPSTTKAVKRFLDLAKSRGSDLIALYTHNKRGIERFISGSFAETAVHYSHVDLLLGGPTTKYGTKLKCILYASDFSSQSKKELQKVIAICKKAGAKLKVFHAAEVVYRWSLDETNPKILAYRKATDRMVQWIKDTCEKAKVSYDVSIKSEFTSVSELVFKAANEAQANLIVVGAKTGPLGALMGGSVARQIIRNGRYPVLILKS